MNQQEEIKTNELIHLMQKYGAIPAIGTSRFIQRYLDELPTWKTQLEQERKHWMNEVGRLYGRAQILEMKNGQAQCLGQRIGRRLNLLAKKRIITIITETRPRSIWSRGEHYQVPVRYILNRARYEL